MTLQDIPAGAAVFLDANTIVYALTGHPTYGAACATLLDRVESKDITAFTSLHVLGEVVHRMMTMEASQRFGWPAQGIASRLRRHPDGVKQLQSPRRGLDEVHAAGVTELPVFGHHVSRGVDLSQQFGLLNNDAVIVAVMRDQGLTHLASLDADFDRVPGIVRYAPV